MGRAAPRVCCSSRAGCLNACNSPAGANCRCTPHSNLYPNAEWNRATSRCMTQEQHAQPRACAAQPSRCRSLGTRARREHPPAAVVRALPPAAACSRWAACCVLTPTSVHDAVSYLADKGVATAAAPAPPAPGGSNAPPTGSGEASSACAHAALLRPLAAHSEVSLPWCLQGLGSSRAMLWVPRYTTTATRHRAAGAPSRQQQQPTPLTAPRGGKCSLSAASAPPPSNSPTWPCLACPALTAWHLQRRGSASW